MPFPSAHTQAILDLEARHDEVLQLLADLEQRVAAVLSQHEPPGRGPLAAAPAEETDPTAGPLREAA